MLSGALPGVFLFDLALLQSKASTFQRPLTLFRKASVVVFAVAVVVVVAWRFSTISADSQGLLLFLLFS